MSWQLIESDPDLFTELVSAMGIKGVQFEELYSLDEQSFENKGTVFGLIFLFRWRNDLLHGADDPMDEKGPVNSDKVYFAKQVIENACATQAIISIALNSPKLEIGETLETLKAFTQEFSPHMKGLALSNSDSLRRLHNGFAKITTEEICAIPDNNAKEASAAVQKAVLQDADSYHFISYVPVDGCVYELDGLVAGPVNIGAFKEHKWVEVAAPAIQRRIKKYSDSEIRFNLMAMVEDRLAAYQAQQWKLQSLREALQQSIAQVQESFELAPELSARLREDEKIADLSPDSLREHLRKIEEALDVVEKKVREEEAQAEKRKSDNIRRKFNYFPFMVEFLKILGKKGELHGLIREAEGW